MRRVKGAHRHRGDGNAGEVLFEGAELEVGRPEVVALSHGAGCRVSADERMAERLLLALACS